MKIIVKMVNSIGAILFLMVCTPIIIFQLFQIYADRYRGMTGEYDELGRFKDSSVADYNLVLWKRRDMLEQAKRAREYQKHLGEARARVDSYYSKRFDKVIEESRTR